MACRTSSASSASSCSGLATFAASTTALAAVIARFNISPCGPSVAEGSRSWGDAPESVSARSRWFASLSTPSPTVTSRNASLPGPASLSGISPSKEGGCAPPRSTSAHPRGTLRLACSLSQTANSKRAPGRQGHSSQTWCHSGFAPATAAAVRLLVSPWPTTSTVQRTSSKIACNPLAELLSPLAETMWTTKRTQLSPTCDLEGKGRCVKSAMTFWITSCAVRPSSCSRGNAKASDEDVKRRRPSK
mmetsp:Transcript_40979/g.123739  ORF Transcript_40979/g.123739 Transcript_40979/m.123739 type:complete len:246 (-) Transcript_40979:510-1247(-)